MGQIAIPFRGLGIVLMVLMTVGAGYRVTAAGESDQSANGEDGLIDPHTPSTFHYDPGNRREPFRSMLMSKTGSINPSTSSGQIEPEWRVLGIMSGRLGYRALIIDSLGNRSIVQPGSRLSSGDWEVERITEATLILKMVDPERRASHMNRKRTIRVTFAE